MDALRYHLCPLPLPAISGWKRLLASLAGFVLPKADPDFWLQTRSIAYWWLELDDRSVVRREIGFSESGDPLRLAPIGTNYGVFVGEEVASSHLGPALDSAAFQDAWGRASAIWASRTHGGEVRH